MAYKVTQRISACRAPPGGAQNDLSRKSLLHRKNGGFSGAIIVSIGEAWSPATGERTVTARLPMASAATIQL